MECEVGVLYDCEADVVYFINYVGLHVATGRDEYGSWVVMRRRTYQRLRDANEVEMIVLLARILHGTRVTLPNASI